MMESQERVEDGERGQRDADGVRRQRDADRRRGQKDGDGIRREMEMQLGEIWESVREDMKMELVEREMRIEFGQR